MPSRSRGLSLVEIILAIGVFAVLAAGLLDLVIAPMYSTGNVAGQERGMYLGQEGIEAAKAIRNTGWSKLTLGVHGLAISGIKWSFSGVSDNSPSGCLTGSSDCYTRVVTVSQVSRSGTKCDGDIVTSGGCVDQRTRLVESDVTWTTPFGTAQAVHYATYVTNWDNYSRKYETDADFAGAAMSGTTVTGTGDPAVVTLAAGDPVWDPSDGSTVDSTNDADWNAGTFNSSVTTGLGTPASVIMSPTAAWTSYAVPLVWSETTNTDFNDGSNFTNTAVADTGDLSAVVLNTTVDWAQRTSPQSASAYNDTDLYSTAFGFAVGNGGVIARWDGTDWTAVSSTTTENLNGVEVVSTADAWAVGANGKIMHWNGSIWSQFTDTGTQVFRDIRMVSASEGYAVADGGYVYRWNGSAWASETSSTVAALMSVAGTSPSAAPGSVSETTDTDFASGAFSNTAVVGTGTAGSVALSTGLNWAAKTAPQTANAYNDVALTSVSFGYAVGNGGVIAKWDGTNWTTVSSPVATALYSVALVTATDGWAVGAGGRIIRLVGTTWSAHTTAASTPTFRSVKMLSTNSGWAVADGGIVYTWNGSAWTFETTPTTENLDGIAGTTPPAAASGSLAETSDADFNDGTFSGTTVVSGSESVTLTGATSWLNLTPVTTQQLNDVFMLSSSDGWAVGASGTVLHWNGTAWSLFVDTGTQTWNGVTCASASDCWMVGSAGLIWHYNGTAWSLSTTIGTWTWNDIACPAANLCFAVRTSGAGTEYIASWNGTSWNGNAYNMDTFDWYDVSCVSTSYCRAGGSSGRIGMWNGTTWTTAATMDTGSDAWYGISMVDANNGFAVTTGGWIARCSSSNCDATADWARSDLGNQNFRAVSAVSASLAFAVADGGIIYRWNGISWASETEPVTANLLGVSAVSSSFVVAVGATGAIGEYALHYPTSGTQTYTSDALDAGAAASWGTLSWTETLPAGTNVTIAFQTSADGTTWTGWSAPQTLNTGVVVTSQRNRYFQYRATLSTTNASSTPSLDSLSVTYDTSTPTLFAVGASGTVFGRNGSLWAPLASFSGYVFGDVDCTSSTDCWAVANAGRTVRLVGTAWSAYGTFGTQSFNGVSLASTSVGLAVGNAGTIYRWDGATWAADTSSTASVLNGVFAISSSYAVAVGAAGTIVEYATHYPITGTRTYTSSALDAGTATATWGTLSWTETLPTDTDLTIATRTSADGTTWSAWSAEQTTAGGVAVTSPDARYLQYRATLTTTTLYATPLLDSINITYDASAASLFAVTSTGVIIGRNSVGWSQVASFGGVVFAGVSCVSGTDCWAVADSGRFYSWDGSAWTLFNDYGTQTFKAVAMVSSSLGWAVANGGLIYRWNGTAWATATSPTTSNLYGVSSVSSTFAVGVGAAGVIIEYGQHYAASGTYTSHVFDGQSSQTWSEVSWGETLPGGTDITSVKVETSTNGTTWAGGAAAVTCTASPCNISTLTSGRYARYTVTETTPAMNRNITPRLESIVIEYNQPLLYDYYDLYMTSPTDGYAAGFDSARTSGGIAHWDGTGWSNVTLPSGLSVAFYNGIGGSGPNDIWADDDGGDWMLHWNGSTWTQYSITALTGSSWMNDVKCLEGDSTNCRAAGSNGLMLRWNAGTNAWVDENVGTTTATLQWMDYVSANELFAVGSGGTILHYLNGTWSTAIVGPTSNQWQGIAMNSATDGWVVGGDNNGDNAYMRHWDGSAWNTVTLPGTPTTYELQNVYCLNEDFCWAGGGYGTSEVVILKWDGTSWTVWLQGTSGGQTGVQTEPVIDTYRIKAIWADTTTHAWAVASNKGFLEFKANYPTDATWVSPAIDSNKVGTVWNMISWDTVRPPTTNLTLATRTAGGAGPGLIDCATTGAWSAWSAEYTEPGGEYITSPVGQCLQYRATFTSGNQVSTATLDAVRIIHSALTPEPLYDIEGMAANDIWSVGDAGVLAHFNGTAWSLATSPTAATLRGIDMQTTSLAFAVGSGGTIVKWNGSAWALDPQSSILTMEDLYDVEFTGPTEAWAVGTSGTIIRWNGTTWATSASGTSASLMGLAMVDASNGFAVGAGGVIRRWNGSAWATSTSNTTQNLYGANCVDMTFCAAVGGDNGTIVMWNGSAWAVTIPSDGPLTSRLNGVGFQALDDGWAVGDMGATIRWDGTSWTHPKSGFNRNLYSVNYPGGGLAWITGEVGSIMSVSSLPGGDGTFLGLVLDTGSTASVFSEVFFAYGSPSPSAITVAFRAGDVEVPDGTWTAWGTEHTLPAADNSAFVAVDPSVSPHQYFQYRLTLTTTDEDFIPTVDAFDVTYQ